MQTPDSVYLNHAGTSWPKPSSVHDAVTSFQQLDPTLWTAFFEDAIRTVAEFFHVPAGRLLMTPGCTSALSISLMDQPWREGDVLVTSQFEHHALQRNLVKLASGGVRIKILQSAETGLVDLMELESVLRSGKVRMVAMTAACNVTGMLLPLAEVVALAHRFDAAVLIDGAQIAGWWDLDLLSLGVDLFTFAGHKGLQAPWGIGGLYVSERIRMSCPHASCERQQNSASDDGAAMPGYCDVGSLNMSALSGLAAACWWLSDSEQRDRLLRARQLTASLTDALKDMQGVHVLHDVPVSEKMPAVAVRVADQTATEVAHRLRQHAVIVSGGHQCAPQAHLALGTQEQGAVRFSFGPMSGGNDVVRAAAAMREVVLAES